MHAMYIESGAMIPKAPRQRIQTFARARLHAHHSRMYRNNPNYVGYPNYLDVQLGDIFKIPFGWGSAGFLVNQIYERNGYAYVKGCRWHKISLPVDKRWWAKNSMLQELPLPRWELIPMSNSAKLQIIPEDKFSSDTLAYLQGTLNYE